VHTELKGQAMNCENCGREIENEVCEYCGFVNGEIDEITLAQQFDKEMEGVHG